MITLFNAKEKVHNGGVILLEPIYETKARRWWFIPLPSRKFWKLDKEITVELSNGEIITIEKGFITDLSSVPQFLWALLPPYGPFILACLIHDWLYMNNGHKVPVARHTFTQGMADHEMYLWSNALCDNRWDNKIRLWGVRVGGKSWWKPKKHLVK